MTLDDQAADRLVAFCARLPKLPSERSEAQREARFVLDCFARRQRELEGGDISGNSGGQDFARVRCELEALVAASRVVTQILERSFGAA